MEAGSDREASLRPVLVLAGTALVLYAADQVTKALVVANVALGDRHDVIGDLAQLWHVRNDGAAFSILPGATWLFVPVTLVAIGMVVYFHRTLVGRGPWGNLYEFSIAFAWGILLGYVYLGRRYPLRAIAFLPIGVATFLCAYAFTLPQEISPLVPALDNAPLLTIHVSMAVLSYGILAVSFGAAVGYLVQGRENRVSWLPPAKVLDEVAYRAVIIGFPIFATLIILGSWWAAIAWGRYWGWDPKETSALVTWLIYAVYLHARSQRGWAGRPAALILVIGFIAVMFTYLGGNLFFGGLHSYSGS